MSPLQTENTSVSGRRIAGKYQVIRKLSQGGMGHVYLAKHIDLEELRAIKVLPMELAPDETTKKRFLNEIKNTHRICRRNEHIVMLYDTFGFEESYGYYVMEYLEGDLLTARIERRPGSLPIAWCLQVAMDVCNAMETAHEEEIVHRDLKPDNIFLIEHRGRPDFVKIVDFGISRSNQADTKLTKTGTAMGTVYYMSPEQITGEPNAPGGVPLDGRSDIYALGCILFEMLSGVPPFDMADQHSPLAVNQLLMSHLQQPPPSLIASRPEVTKSLEDIVFRALEKKPKDRFPNMQAFREALEQELTIDHTDTPQSENVPSAFPPTIDISEHNQNMNDTIRNDGQASGGVGQGTLHEEDGEHSEHGGYGETGQFVLPEEDDNYDEDVDETGLLGLPEDESDTSIDMLPEDAFPSGEVITPVVESAPEPDTAPQTPPLAAPDVPESLPAGPGKPGYSKLLWGALMLLLLVVGCLLYMFVFSSATQTSTTVIVHKEPKLRPQPKPALDAGALRVQPTPPRKSAPTRPRPQKAVATRANQRLQSALQRGHKALAIGALTKARRAYAKAAKLGREALENEHLTAVQVAPAKAWSLRVLRALKHKEKLERSLVRAHFKVARAALGGLMKQLASTPASQKWKRRFAVYNLAIKRGSLALQQGKAHYQRKRWGQARKAFKRYLTLFPKAQNQKDIRRLYAIAGCELGTPWRLCKQIFAKKRK